MKQLGISDFVKRQTPESRFSHYEGDWEKLRLLTEASFGAGAYRAGYRDGVVLVPVAPAGFFSGIVPVKESTKLRSFLTRRRPEECPFIETVACGTKPPAMLVDVVCYRKDVLEEGGDPSTGADWDVISVNACGDLEAAVPMSPVAMARNQLERPGGTKAHYSSEEWARAVEYWSTHAMIDPASAS